MFLASDEFRQTVDATWRKYRRDLDNFALARFWAERKSKDPSTQVGAVITDKHNRIRGIGYNGFPRGVEDAPELYNDRAEKYPRVVHAELNALQGLGDLEGCTITVWPLFTCSRCAGPIINSGISRVVCGPMTDRNKSEYEIAAEMYEQAGIEVFVIHPDELDEDGAL